MPDNYSVAIETGGYRLLELFAERCGDDAAVTITDGDGHQIASHAMPVAERRHRFLIPVPTNDVGAGSHTVDILKKIGI